MDIFVRNVPQNATKKQLEKYFAAPFAQCGINVFHAEKFRDKPLATLTVLDIAAGQKFLDDYGVPQGAPHHARAKNPLKWENKFLLCSKSRNEPSRFSVRSLAYEASQQAPTAATTSSANKAAQGTKNTRFNISTIQCGVWDYAGTRLAFTAHYRHDIPGTVTFGAREAIILLGNTGSDQSRIDLQYYDCDNIILGTYDDPSISFTLKVAPRFYQVCGLDVLSAQLTALALGPSAAKSKTVKKKRLTHLDDIHAKVAATCFVYRVNLSDSSTLSKVRTLLGGSAKMPSNMSMHTPTLCAAEPLGRSKERLDVELTDTRRYGDLPFSMRYQLDRLARNGVLSPLKVIQLLAKVREIHKNYGLDASLASLRKFYRQAPGPGPNTEAYEVSPHALGTMLDQYAAEYDLNSPENPYELAKRHTHINLVHKVVVTPAGTYLEGPEPEPTNRVLRKYSSQTDCFIRVIFQDEDGGSVRYDPRSSQHLIYHQRFKQVLDNTILIAGFGFSFLGFSHSSLRSQSCWFMAPIFEKGSLVFAPQVIKELGDFSHIRTPAKCAAR